MPNKKELGKLYKKDAKAIADALEAMSECERGGWLGVAAAAVRGEARRGAPAMH